MALAGPFSGLTTDSAGNLYGTTDAGASNDGAVFEIVKRSGALLTLYSFTGGTNGANPAAGLVADGAGNLYGTTEQGGASGDGNIRSRRQELLSGHSPPASIRLRSLSYKYDALL